MGTCCVTRKLKDPSGKAMPQTTQLWHNGKDKILHCYKIHSQDEINKLKKMMGTAAKLEN